MSSDNVDLKVEDVNILPKITSIVDDALIDPGTLIIDEVHVSSDSTSNDVNEIVESNILTKPNKSFEFSCDDYEFMIIPTELSPTESSEFLTMIKQMVLVSSFTGCKGGATLCPG